MTNVPITDEFTSYDGRLVNYDPLDATVVSDLPTQRHINIRSFQGTGTTHGMLISSMDLLGMSNLNQQAISAIENQLGQVPLESWTGGTITIYDPAGGPRNMRVLAINGTAGTTVTAQSFFDKVDLATGFSDTDHISVAMPTFDATNVDISRSYLDFIEQDGTVTTLPFSSSLTPITTGPTEARWLRSSLNGHLHPTSVRFRIYTNSNGTNLVRIAALRLLDANWKDYNMEINTEYQRLEPAISRTGSLPTRTYPIMWRSDFPPKDPPRPIDLTTSVLLNPGSMSTRAPGTLNTFAQYFRERNEDFVTQLDIYGTPMSILNGKRMPDYSKAAFSPRPQSDLEGQIQSQLEHYTQGELERVPDTVSEAWMAVEFQWDTTLINVRLSNTEGADYERSIYTPLSANTEYIVFTYVENTGVRVIVKNNSNNTTIMDTNITNDDFSFKRRRGRFGWRATMQDHDSYVKNVKAQHAVFNEFQSIPGSSMTPVEGARITADMTPDQQLYTGALPFNGALVVSDPSQGGADRIDTNAVYQGLITLPTYFESFADTFVTFDILVPSGAPAPNLALIDEDGGIADLTLPSPLYDQWRTVSITLAEAALNQVGTHELLFYTLSSSPAHWWMRNLAIQRRTVEWSARATDDPWDSNGSPWTDFREMINNPKNGILFPQRGRALQVRGRALTQDATINKVYVRPKYAELGNFAWGYSNETLQTVKPNRAAGEAWITTSPAGTTPSITLAGTTYTWAAGDGGWPYNVTITLTGNASIPGGTISSWKWDFGDGTTASTQTVNHNWQQPGVYTTHLTVTDTRGNQFHAYREMQLTPS